MPTLAELMTNAVSHYRAGRFFEVEALCRQIVQRDPRQSQAYHLLGLAAHASGRFDVAVQAIDQAIALEPSSSAFYFQRGEAQRKLGRIDEAEASYTRAAQLDPSQFAPFNARGIAQQMRGALPEAEASFREAARLAPGQPSVLNNLGTILLLRGACAEAEAYLAQALRLQPNYAQALMNMGAVLIGLGRFPDAQTYLQRAIQLSPQSPVAHHNMGIVLRKLGRVEDAEASLREALRLDSHYAPAHFELGSLLKDAMRLEEAQAWLKSAVRLAPDAVEPLKGLAAVFGMQGKLELARDRLDDAIAIQPSDGLHVRKMLMLPPIYGSLDELHDDRERFEQELRSLSAESLTIRNPVGEVALTPFFLAYQGMNDRESLVTLASLLRRAAPELSFVADHCREGAPPRSTSQRSIKVGFVSSFFFRHTIAKLNLGFIRNLSRELFSVTLLRFPAPDDEFTQVLAGSADCVVNLSSDLATARAQIAAEALDVVYFTDIGMDPLTYFLAFARLAPVQCVSWGHPVTSGVSTIDYFLSSARMETESADPQYSETLVRFANVNVCYAAPQLSGPRKSRRNFGLEDGVPLYVCSQTPFKLHPEFDSVLRGILGSDPQGTIVLLSGNQPSWEHALRERFRLTIREHADRIRFLPALSQDDFAHLQAVADVLLDTFPFCGGNTSYEAFAVGTPVVTLPTGLLRGRLTQALYQQMDVLDCVAATPEDYVRIAIRLGTDPSWRAQISERILGQNHRLFDDLSVVRELERFLVSAVERARAVP